MDGLDGRFEVHPDVLKAQAQRGASVDGVGAEHPAQFREQRVQSGVHGGGVGFSPEGLSQLVSWNRPVPVNDQIGKQESALSARKAALEALAAALYHEGAAQLDARLAGSRQCHANILAIRWAPRC